MSEVKEFDCGFKEGDAVRLPRTHSGSKNSSPRGTVVKIEPGLKTSLTGKPYQFVIVKDLRGNKGTWASTVLVKA